MTPLLMYVLLVAASYRIWRFLAEDDITTTVRLKLPDKVVQPLRCAWCAGFWISLVVVVLVDSLHGLPLPVLWVLAVSTGVGLIAHATD